MHMYLGKTWKVGDRGRVHVFPYVVENPTGPTRTDAQTRFHAKDALSTDLPVRVTSRCKHRSV